MNEQVLTDFLLMKAINFINKWGLNTAPLSKIGSYKDFSLLIKELKIYLNKIKNSSIQNDELGSIVYFVQKEEANKVLTMGKIETKESIALLQLIKILRDFWSNNEILKGYSRDLDKQYDSAFNYYTEILNSLDIKDYKYYFELADLAFIRLKEDLDLYEKLKLDIPAFFIDILKKLGEPADAFISSTLSKSSEVDDFNETHKLQTLNNEEIWRKTENDDHESLLKNENIEIWGLRNNQNSTQQNEVSIEDNADFSEETKSLNINMRNTKEYLKSTEIIVKDHSNELKEPSLQQVKIYHVNIFLSDSKLITHKN